MPLKRTLGLFVCVAVSVFLGPCRATADDVTKSQALDALHQAVDFFRTQASASGAYVYRWSADLSKREGEGRVGATTGWVEPPGTPSVGKAYLEAHQLTGDALLLEAALETGMALVQTQLVSGGWDSNLEFAAQDRSRYAYRAESSGAAPGLRNTTTFDDDKTQSAIRFLMHLDQLLAFGNEAIHEAAIYALDAAIQSQYPNGAWPQRYDRFPDPQQHPVRAARYPDEWPREFPGPDYAGYYTLNDNTISDLIRTMLEAYDIYGDDRFWQSALRGGDFLLLAQMPDPQPGWAQQYNHHMEPAWARRFEPPSITGGEAQGVMRTLIRLFDRTGEERFLEPLPRALEYYRQSQLPDGRLARFYELRTNRPLFFTKDYRLTYRSDDMPTHYAFLVASGVDTLQAQYAEARRLGARRQPISFVPAKPELSTSLAQRAANIITSLDNRGAWVESGRLRYHGDDDETREVIESQTFAHNVLALAQFIAAN